jgi:hypothetical protein
MSIIYIINQEWIMIDILELIKNYFINIILFIITIFYYLNNQFELIIFNILLFNLKKKFSRLLIIYFI